MRKIRPKRKHTASVRNPLKTTSVEVKLEYEEVKMGYAELEIRRKQKEKSKAEFSLISISKNFYGLSGTSNFFFLNLKTQTWHTDVTISNENILISLKNSI